jgi:hypothetical protein
VQRVFSDAVSIAPLINNTDELTVLVDDVKITFLKYPFPFVIYEQVPLLSVREIAATTAYTIGRHGAYKDYIDLYFTLSKQHATLTDIIDIGEKKFGFEFDSRLFLEQLVFLDDVEDTDIQVSQNRSHAIGAPQLLRSDRYGLVTSAAGLPSLTYSRTIRDDQNQL